MGMRTIQTEFIEKGLKQVDRDVLKNEQANYKKQAKRNVFS